MLLFHHIRAVSLRNECEYSYRVQFNFTSVPRKRLHQLYQTGTHSSDTKWLKLGRKGQHFEVRYFSQKPAEPRSPETSTDHGEPRANYQDIPKNPQKTRSMADLYFLCICTSAEEIVVASVHEAIHSFVLNGIVEIDDFSLTYEQAGYNNVCVLSTKILRSYKVNDPSLICFFIVIVFLYRICSYFVHFFIRLYKLLNALRLRTTSLGTSKSVLRDSRP